MGKGKKFKKKKTTWGGIEIFQGMRRKRPGKGGRVGPVQVCGGEAPVGGCPGGRGKSVAPPTSRCLAGGCLVKWGLSRVGGECHAWGRARSRVCLAAGAGGTPWGAGTPPSPGGPLGSNFSEEPRSGGAIGGVQPAGNRGGGRHTSLPGSHLGMSPPRGGGPVENKGGTPSPPPPRQ